MLKQLILCLLLATIASAWFNSSYEYRVPCYVNSSNGSLPSLSNLPVHCIFDTQSLYSSGKMFSQTVIQPQVQDNNTDTYSLATTTGYTGMKISPNYNILITNTTKFNTMNCTTAYICNNRTCGIQYANATFIGDTATFNYTMTAGSIYWFECDAIGGSYNYAYKLKTMPVSGVNLNWLSCNDFGSEYTTYHVGYPTGINSTATIANLSSILVADANDVPLPYEVENNTLNTSATVGWIRLPSSNATGNDTVYLYYSSSYHPDNQSKSVWTINETTCSNIYHFGEVLGTYFDSAVNATNLTSVYLTSSSNIGKYGRSFSSTGTSYAYNNSLGCMPISNASTSTMMAWINTSDNDTNVNVAVGFGGGTGTGVSRFIIQYSRAQAECEGTACYGLGGYGVDGGARSAKTTLSQWQSIATVYSGSPIHDVWSNGTKNASVPWTSATKYLSNITYNCMRIGGVSSTVCSAAQTFGFVGLIDEVRIYNISLPDDYITAMYVQTDYIGAEETLTTLTSMVGTATNWSWSNVTAGVTIRSGTPTNWSWHTYSAGSGNLTVNGSATNWTWVTE